MAVAPTVPIGGQIVLVTTARLEGGEPLRTPYIVAERDPAKAEEAIRAIMAPNETVEAVWPLPVNVIEAFGLRPGDFTPWRASL